MTCAWIETSSAETGSSATMNFGSTASARAIPIALALAAGELVRIAVRVIRLQADHREQLLNAPLGVLPVRQPVDRAAVRG